MLRLSVFMYKHNTFAILTSTFELANQLCSMVIVACDPIDRIIYTESWDHCYQLLSQIQRFWDGNFIKKDLRLDGQHLKSCGIGTDVDATFKFRWQQLFPNGIVFQTDLDVSSDLFIQIQLPFLPLIFLFKN